MPHRRPGAPHGPQPSEIGIRSASVACAGIEAIKTELRQQRIASCLAAQFAVAEVERGFLYFRAILKSVSDALLDRLGFRLDLGCKMIRRDHRQLLKNWIVERTGDGVLHVEFLEFKVGACDSQVLLARSHFAFSLEHIHLGNSLEGELLAAGVKCLRGKGNRALSNLLGVVGIHKVPVDIADLRDGRDNLRLECDVSNLLVGPGNS